MNLIEEHNKKYQFFVDITGIAMKVYNKYHFGLLESAYEAALKYLLEQDGYKVERQVFLPIYWDDVKLDQTYRMDLVINDDIIVELKSIQYITDDQRKQLKNYLNITHLPYGCSSIFLLNASIVSGMNDIQMVQLSELNSSE